MCLQGIFTINAHLSYSKILVLPAESNPSINTLISLFPKILDRAFPILADVVREREQPAG